MKIAIYHTGPISELLVASSVNIGIKKQPIKTDITWIVSNENTYLFKYNKNVSRTISVDEFDNSYKYDLFINLWPYLSLSDLKANVYTGFGFYNEFEQFKDPLLGINNIPKMRISNFQLYFLLSGLTWKGEGYDIGYYPKTKSKKNRIGMSAANANLRNYVLDNLEIDDKKIWCIPYKKNVFKRMDEINRCKKIITDDLLTFHLAMAMKKYVYYLEVYPQTLKLETFGNGQIHFVPYNYLK